MSNLPQFLPTTNPYQAVLTYGDQLAPADVTQLRKEMSALHFRPVVVVLPVSCHVKHGEAMVSELAGAWKLGPHSLLVVYSPADKNVWVECGTFNSSAGVDPSFFQHDFLQRMSFSNRDGNLYAALDASLKDVDRVVVRSQAFASAQVNHQASSQVQPRHHGHAAHAKSSPVLQLLPAIFLALIVLFLIGRAMGAAAPRRRFDDVDNKSSDLADDVDRIRRVMQNSESGTAAGASKPRNYQIPMAEFKKRADVLVKAGGSGSENQNSMAKVSGGGSKYDDRRSLMSRISPAAQDDHSNELKTAIDSSAARVRQEYKERSAANTYDSQESRGDEPQPAYEPQAAYEPQTAYEAQPAWAAQPASEPEPAPAVVQDGQFIDSYVASFNGVAKQEESNLPSASPNLPTTAKLPASVSVSRPVNLPVSVPSSAPGSISSAVTPVSANSSFDLSSFSLQAASAPFADVLSSMGTPLGEMKTSSGGSLPLGSLTSFDTDRDTSVVQAACPKCSEQKSKDFSFCLRCGFNF
jgi:uncharacterized membrane protein YgcG